MGERHENEEGAEVHHNIIISPKPLILSSHICPYLLLETPVKSSLSFRGRSVSSELDLISYWTCSVLSDISVLLTVSVSLLAPIQSETWSSSLETVEEKYSSWMGIVKGVKKKHLPLLRAPWAAEGPAFVEDRRKRQGSLSWWTLLGTWKIHVGFQLLPLYCNIHICNIFVIFCIYH